MTKQIIIAVEELSSIDTKNNYWIYLENQLSNTEKEYFNQKNNPEAQKNYLIARKLLRKLLKKFYPNIYKEFKFTFGKNQRPQITNNLINLIDLSISHSNEVVAVAISEQEIGIDIEDINIERNFLKLAKRWYKSEEYDFLYTAKDKKNTFYSIWTLKESWLKLNGLTIYNINRAPIFTKINNKDLKFNNNYGNIDIKINKRKYILGYFSQKNTTVRLTKF